MFTVWLGKPVSGHLPCNPKTSWLVEHRFPGIPKVQRVLNYLRFWAVPKEVFQISYFMSAEWAIWFGAVPLVTSPWRENSVSLYQDPFCCSLFCNLLLQ